VLAFCVGLWIIFLKDQREEEPNQEEDGKELQVPHYITSQMIEVVFGECHHSPPKEAYWEDYCLCRHPASNGIEKVHTFVADP